MSFYFKKLHNSAHVTASPEENFKKNGVDVWQTLIPNPGADLGLSRGGGGADFQKKIENYVNFFSLGRPSWFFELSQSTVLSLFWPNFLRRRQNFEKNRPQKQKDQSIIFVVVRT